MMLVNCSSLWQDLSKLNRDPAKILYVSGHALESTLQPENSVPIKPWKLEEDDTVLLDLLPFLECKWPGIIILLCRLQYISTIEDHMQCQYLRFSWFEADVARHRPADIRPVLASYQGRDIAKEFIERSKDHQR